MALSMLRRLSELFLILKTTVHSRYTSGLTVMHEMVLLLLQQF